MEKKNLEENRREKKEIFLKREKNYRGNKKKKENKKKIIRSWSRRSRLSSSSLPQVTISDDGYSDDRSMATKVNFYQ